MIICVDLIQSGQNGITFLDVASNVTIEGGSITNSEASAIFLGPAINDNVALTDFLSTFRFCDAEEVLHLPADVTLRFFPFMAQSWSGCTRRIVAPESHLVRVYIRVRQSRLSSSSLEVARFYDGLQRMAANLIETFSARSSTGESDTTFTSLTRELTLQLLVEEGDVEYAEVNTVRFQGEIR